MHAAVDTLGHLLALHVTAANEQDRVQVERLASEVQKITGAFITEGVLWQYAFFVRDGVLSIAAGNAAGNADVRAGFNYLLKDENS